MTEHRIDGVEVLTVGESMGAIRAHGLVRLGPTADISIAGTEGNVAVGLSRLGHAVRWVGVLGADEMGALVRRTLRAEGVDVGSVRIDAEAPTGILVSEQRVSGRARVDYYRSGSAATRITPHDLLSAMEPTPKVLHLTGITVAISESSAQTVLAGARAAHERGVTVCLDVNHRPRLWTDDQAREQLAGLVGLLDIVVADAEELALLADGDDTAKRARWLLDAGVREVLVKEGAAGATAHTSAGPLHVPARQVGVVDTIGAGDAFVAGYLSGLLEGLPMADRLHRANTVAGFVVSSAGDWEGLPTRAELPMLDRPSGHVVR